MIVEAITPTYRTGSAVEGEVGFMLHGHGFLNIRPNQRVYVAVANSAPTEYYGRQEEHFSLDVRVIDDREAECIFRESYNYGDYYLGALGNGIENPVWINRTRPLP